MNSKDEDNGLTVEIQYDLKRKHMKVIEKNQRNPD